MALRTAPAGGVALVHDYLTQRGGAERVVASMLGAFPGAPLYTSLFDPDTTFPVFSGPDVRTLSLNRLAPLRSHHRLALPLLAPAFSRLTVEAEVTLCSSSGWAHGARTTGCKIVYCYTPARWLYQTERYLGEQGGIKRASLGLFGPGLRRWDLRAAQSADRYVAISTAVRDRVRAAYGIDADLLAPPVTIGPADPQAALKRIDAGFWLCVSRLLPYKNVGAVIAAFAQLPDLRLVLVGTGPDEERLRANSPSNVVIIGKLHDEQLAWLYANCQALVAASYEDFGLTPLEANAFGKPVATLAWGGFLDTVRPEVTGFLFNQPTPASIIGAIRRVSAQSWSAPELAAHARTFDEAHFVHRLREIVAEERKLAL